MSLLNIILLNLPKSSTRLGRWGRDEDLIFVKEETKVQREVTGSRSHSWRGRIRTQNPASLLVLALNLHCLFVHQ